MEHNACAMHPPVASPIASYREFAPCEALKRHVRAFFSFIPGSEINPMQREMRCEIVAAIGDSFCPPILADGHVSIAISLGMVCHADGLWRLDPAGGRGHVMGAVTRVDPSAVERPAMIGAYFHAGQFPAFASVPVHELTDRIIGLEDLWGSAASRLPAQLGELDEAARIDRLETLLLNRLEKRRGSHVTVDVPSLAASVVQSHGQMTVEQLAFEAGVSRQHLRRVFQESIGISPKLYSRLARFQSGLVYAGSGKAVDWAQAALDLGYADQSHMIAEFREFSSLTPQLLATRGWLHPFIERAKRQSDRRQFP